MACLVQHVAVWLVISISTFSVRIPLVLGGGAAGLRLATHLRQQTSTRSTWWMPFYHAETKAEVPALMQRISEDSEESETKKHAVKKIKKRWVAFVLGVWSQVFAHNFIKLFYSSHKPWLKWKCIESLKMLGKTWIFSGCGRMAEELGGDWGHCGSVHCCGQQGGTCELWLSGDARSSVLDDAPARGNANEIDVIHLCFKNSSEIGLWQFVVHGSMKGFGKRVGKRHQDCASVHQCRRHQRCKDNASCGRESCWASNVDRLWLTMIQTWSFDLFLFKPWGSLGIWVFAVRYLTRVWFNQQVLTLWEIQASTLF